MLAANFNHHLSQQPAADVAMKLKYSNQDTVPVIDKFLVPIKGPVEKLSVDFLYFFLNLTCTVNFTFRFQYFVCSF
jgi:hypothetical protein